MLIALKSSRQVTATGIITAITPTATTHCQAEAPVWRVMVCNFKRKAFGLQMEYG